MFDTNAITSDINQRLDVVRANMIRCEAGTMVLVNIQWGKRGYLLFHPLSVMEIVEK